MAKAQTNQTTGLQSSVTAFSRTVVSVVHTRLKLLALDLEEDRLHLLQIIQLILLMGFCLAVGMILLTALITVFFWNTHRELILVLLAAMFFIASFLLWRSITIKMKEKPTMFSSSLAELLKDSQSLESRVENNNL
jgi:uncharacterized membrane protein YqjE